MLRVKVYEVDENGAEKLFLDNEGNPIVKEGEGLVMVMQTAEIVDDKIKVDGSVVIKGKINPLAMGTTLNENEKINTWMHIATMHETLKTMLHEDEEETEE